MQQRCAAGLALLVVALAARPSLGATQIAVGGTVGWTLGVAYKPINASIGDTLVGCIGASGGTSIRCLWSKVFERP
jgi:hypothetical protein